MVGGGGVSTRPLRPSWSALLESERFECVRRSTIDLRLPIGLERPVQSKADQIDQGDPPLRKKPMSPLKNGKIHALPRTPARCGHDYQRNLTVMDGRVVSWDRAKNPVESAHSNNLGRVDSR